MHFLFLKNSTFHSLPYCRTCRQQASNVAITNENSLAKQATGHVLVSQHRYSAPSDSLTLVNFCNGFFHFLGVPRPPPFCYKVYLPVRTAPAKPSGPKIHVHVHTQVQRHWPVLFALQFQVRRMNRCGSRCSWPSYIFSWFKNSSITWRVAHPRYQILRTGNETHSNIFNG
jgi:hypothetical protein